MVYSYRSVMAWIAVLTGLSAVQVAASSWPEEFVQRYEAHGFALLHTNEADWAQRTNEYGLSRPTHACQIFVYRAFDLWSQMGAMYRATVSVTQFMIPDEIVLQCIGRILETTGTKRAGGCIRLMTPGRHHACRT